MKMKMEREWGWRERGWGGRVLRLKLFNLLFSPPSAPLLLSPPPDPSFPPFALTARGLMESKWR